METGESVEGKYVGKSSSPWVDKTTGEESQLTRLFFERDDQTKFLLFEDGGLRNAFANAMVTEGDYVKIEKLDKVSIGSGRTSNNYEIFISQ